MKNTKLALASLILICSVASFIFLGSLQNSRNFQSKTLKINDKVENVVKSAPAPSSLPDISVLQKFFIAITDIIKAI